MENIDLMRIPDEAIEEGNDVVDGVDSDSSSISNSDSDSDVGDHPDSDSESAKSEVISDTEELDSFADGPLVRVREIDEQDQFVKNNFLTVMSGIGMRTTVEAVYKNVCPGFTWQAKLKSFQEISRKMEKAGEGLGKVSLAWFGGSKDEINNIARYGFTSRGRGICLSPVNLPTASISCCVADENGLYHMILCRTLLGKSELLTESPEQRFPSSEEFHSAADNLAAPRVYLVWSSYMNTHVMPQYVVSFRPPVKVNGGSPSVRPAVAARANEGAVDAPTRSPVPANQVRASVRPAVQANPARANEGVANAATRPPVQANQDRANEIAKARVLAKEEVAKSRASGEPVRMMPYSKLIEELANVLPGNIISSLHKAYREYGEGKVTKPEMTRTIRQLVGDDVLYRTIMASRRRNAASEEAAPGVSNSVVSAEREEAAPGVSSNSVVSVERKSAARSSANKVLKKLQGAGSP